MAAPVQPHGGCGVWGCLQATPAPCRSGGTGLAGEALPCLAGVGGSGRVPSIPVPWQEWGKIMSVELSDEALFLVQGEQRAGAQAVHLVVVSESAGR